MSTWVSNPQVVGFVGMMDERVLGRRDGRRLTEADKQARRHLSNSQIRPNTLA